VVVKKQGKNQKRSYLHQVGIYGALMVRRFASRQKANNDFLGLTCQKWEAVANEFQEKFAP
jgi:NAD dependent epimerase/dehydratase family enzyme